MIGLLDVYLYLPYTYEGHNLVVLRGYCTQKLLLAGFGILEIELVLATCMTNTLPSCAIALVPVPDTF